MIYVLIIAAIVGIVYWYKTQNEPKDIVVPEPETKRSDLRYGYYSTFGNQIAEVKDHTNLMWTCFWYEDGGEDKAITDMRSFGGDIVVDLIAYLFQSLKPGMLYPEAENRVRKLFDRMRTEGLLQQVKLIVPVDEPNLPETDACAVLPECVSILRRVVADYTELNGVMIGCNYYSGRPKCHTNLFDLVSYDNYGAKSGILAPGGEYEQFRATLRPDQKTMLIPGGYRGQDPVPFVNYAQRNPEIWAVVPFIYWAPTGNKENLTSIRELPVKAAYIAAGKSIINP
jgi:hypothetical protein